MKNTAVFTLLSVAMSTTLASTGFVVNNAQYNDLCIYNSNVDGKLVCYFSQTSLKNRITDISGLKGSMTPDENCESPLL